MKMKTQQPKTYGTCKSSAKGKVHSNTGISQETRKKSNNSDRERQLLYNITFMWYLKNTTN